MTAALERITDFRPVLERPAQYSTVMDGQGRWFLMADDTGVFGVLWTNDADALSLTGVPGSDAEHMKAGWTTIRAAKAAGVPARVEFDRLSDLHHGEVEAGPLIALRGPALFKYNPGQPRNAQGEWSPGIGGGAGIGVRESLNTAHKAPAAHLAKARSIAKEKFAKLPVPTDADRAEAKIRHSRSNRAGGDDRPSAAKRRQIKQQLVDEFGNGKTCPCVACGAVLTPALVSMDRLVPGSDGGPYKLPNLIPMDYNCNRARSNDPFEEMMAAW